MLCNKYKMTIEENIFCAKRILVDSIYMQANLEGIAVTFAETQDILNNVNVMSITPNDINKVCWLRDGWDYLLGSLNKPTDLVFMEELHELIARFDVPYIYLGKLRVEDVIIRGTTWRPEIPNVEKIFHEISEILKIENDVICGEEFEYCVIATGGSAIYRGDAIDKMRKNGVVVYLKISYEEMARRLGDFSKRGVVLKDGYTLLDLYNERTPLYEKHADYVVELDGLTIEESVGRIKEKIQCELTD